MRREFNTTARRAIVERATGDDGRIRCEACGSDLTAKAFEIDHVIPEGLVPEWRKDKPLTAAEGQLLGACCHRGEEGKTNKDVKQIAKAKRQRAKHQGLKTSKKPIQSAGFQKAEKARTQPTKVMRRRKIYE